MMSSIKESRPPERKATKSGGQVKTCQMCKLKSGIILKNRVFVPEYDSHTEKLEELGIKDDYLNASKTFVRVELSPKDGDVFSDIDSWVMSVDQDITPDWYNEEEYKPQVVEAVKKWAKTHIHIGVDGLRINEGQNHFIKDCKDVIIYGDAAVKYIYDNATVVSSPCSNWENKGSLIISESAIFKDRYTKTIYQAGDWKLISVESERKING